MVFTIDKKCATLYSVKIGIQVPESLENFILWRF